MGGLVAAAGVPLVDLVKVDDPVGAVAVHGFGGIWVINISLFPLKHNYFCRQ